MRAWHVILILACLVVSFMAGYHIRGNGADTSRTTDTVTYIDTVYDSVPYPVYETLSMEIPEPFPVYVTLGGDTVRDTIYVQVPITQKEYRTEDYRLFVSGYKPMLDNIEIYRKTEYITRTVYPRRWGIGVIAGYGIGKHGLSPYAGIGGYYRIW